MNFANGEIKGLIIKDGARIKITAGTYTVSETIVIRRGAKLIVESAALNFEKGCGIFCEGSIEAKEAKFSSAPSSENWSGITILVDEKGADSVFSHCFFEGSEGSDDGMILKYSPEMIEKMPVFFGGEKKVTGALTLINLTRSLDPDFIIKNCGFKNCEAEYGGGIFCYNCAPEIHDCVFDDCRARIKGGGINSIQSDTKITASKFNSCSGGTGGGVYFCGTCDVLLSKCGFEKCAAVYFSGGGVAVEIDPDDDHKQVETVSDDEIEIETEVLANIRSGLPQKRPAQVFFTFKDCAFHDCGANNSGGGLSCWEAHGAIENSSFTKCYSIESGGGAHFDLASISIEDSNFYECHSKNGGGISAAMGSMPTLFDSAFNCCEARETGGGIYLDLCETIMTGCHFGECRARYGGGVYRSSGVDSISSSRFIKCSAQKRGSAICFRDEKDLSVNNCEMSNCEMQSEKGFFGF